MKTKLRTIVLAAAGVVGSVAVAQAQPAPEPAPAPAAPPPAAAEPTPPAPPEPAPVIGVAPLAAPAPGSPSDIGGVAGPDSLSPGGPPPTPNRFRGTSFSWTHSASTKIFGIGPDYIGTEDEVYQWDFAFTPRFYVYDTPVNQVYVNANLGWSVEMTNNDFTAEKRELFFNDLLVGVGYNRVLHESKDKEFKTSVAPTASLLLPTSQYSREQGKYLSTGLGVALRSNLKLAGSKSAWLPAIQLSGSVSWQHLFAKSYSPVNPDLNRPRQDSRGETLLSDQISTKAFVQNNVKLALGFGLPLYKDLSIGSTFAYSIPSKHDFAGSDCEVQVDNVPGGCVAGERLPDRTFGVPSTSFDVALSYGIFDVASIDLGYNNTTSQLGEDGLRRASIFASPDSQFYLSAALLLDGIYDKVAERARRKPAPTTTGFSTGAPSL